MSQVNITFDAERFEKFLREAPDKVGKILQNIIYQGALLVERESKIRAPVDTGRLRASISTDIYPMRAEIHPNVNYAIFVHDGTRYMAARPFMDEAADTVDKQLQNLVEDELKRLE